MKKINLNTLICLWVPVLVLLAIGFTAPNSGLAMIMKGFGLLVVQSIGALGALLWSTFSWAIPLMSAGLVSLLIFKLKAKASAGFADYACAAVAGVSALALSMHQGLAGSLPLIFGALFGLMFYHDCKSKLDRNHVVTGALIFFTFISSLSFMIGQVIVHAEEGLSDQKTQLSAVSELYKEFDDAAFARDDATMMSMIKDDHKWARVMQDVDSAPTVIATRGQEVIFEKGGRVLFVCDQGQLMIDADAGPIKQAIGRRTCAKRAGLVN